MDEIEAAFTESQLEMRSLKKKIDDVRRKAESLREKMDSEVEKKKEAEERLNRVKDEKKIRLNRLFGSASHVKASYEWVDQNRKMFRRPVWGPVGKCTVFQLVWFVTMCAQFSITRSRPSC